MPADREHDAMARGATGAQDKGETITLSLMYIGNVSVNTAIR